MKLLFTTFLFFTSFTFCSGQEMKMQVEISNDTLLLGNYIELKFTLKNASAQFELPEELNGFQIVSGPNVSSSMTSINGKVSQEMIYSIFLQPTIVGKLTIGPAYFTLDIGAMKTSPIEINVLDNPDEQQQSNPNLKVVEEIILEGEGKNFKAKRMKVKRYKI